MKKGHRTEIVVAVAAGIGALVAVLTLAWQLGWIPTRKSHPPETKIELSKQSGPPGSTVRVRGSGFVKNETVRLYVNVYQVGETEADGSGQFSWISIRIPKALAQFQAVLQQAYVRAAGVRSKRQDTEAFNLTGGAPQPGPPAPTPSPTPPTPPPSPSPLPPPTTTPPPPPDQRKVPAVVGRLYEVAASALQSIGFKVSRRTIASAEPVDTVIAQDPAANKLASVGSTITLTVSKGSETRDVPDVTSMDLDAAKATLEAAGFKVDVQARQTSDPAQDNVVLEEVPAGGTRATPGSTVTVIVGRFA
jgi:hypothetical protein